MMFDRIIIISSIEFCYIFNQSKFSHEIDKYLELPETKYSTLPNNNLSVTQILSSEFHN